LQPRHFRARQKSSEVGKHIQLSNDDHHQLQNQLNLYNDSSSNHSPLKQQQQNQQPGAHIKCPASGAMSSDTEDDNDEDSRGLPNKKPKASSSVISIKEEIDMDNNHHHHHHHHESTSNNSMSIKRRKSEDDHSDSMDIKSEMSKNDGNVPRKKNAVRSQLAQQIIQSSSKQLKKPIYPVRPANASSSPTMSSFNSHFAFDQKLLLQVFKYLPQETLVTCSLVCKSWAQVRSLLNFLKLNLNEFSFEIGFH
jgi:F-box and leucine-rich repeat protein 10/11